MVNYSLERILEIALLESKEPRPTTQSLHAYWDCLMRWIQGQMICDRKILIPSFGFIVSMQVGEVKTLGTLLLSTFLESHGLRYKEDIQESNRPIISLQYVAVSKMLGVAGQPQLLSKMVQGIFKTILGLLELQNVGLDLGPLGKMTVREKVLGFQPFIPSRRKHQGRMTVSQVVAGKQNTFRIKTKLSQFPMGLDQSSILICKQDSLNESHLQQQRVSFLPCISLQPKKQIKPDFTRSLDMLGEASDPLGLGYNFSELIRQPSQLMHTKFTKSDFCKPRFPPVLDNSSQTIASPITNQKYNLSISGRIACNYNIPARSLYFDKQSRCIKNYVMKEGIKFRAQSLLLQAPASDSEELLYLAGDKQFQRKVTARRKCFQRYNQYTLKLIPFSLVAPPNKDTVKKMLMAAGVGKETALDKVLTQTVDQTLQVVVRDYYYSGRKAILDYILKDKDERERIGIMQVLEQVPLWGKAHKRKIQFSSPMRNFIRLSRQSTEAKLLLTPCSVKIMAGWKSMQNQLFVVFNNKPSATNLLYFIKKQQENIAQVRNNLRRRWIGTVTDLARDDAKAITNKDRLNSFYRSLNTLVFNLLRSLVQRSLIKYLQFFQPYRKEKYHTLQQVIANESIIEQTFLTVKLKDQNHQIVFAEDLQSHVKPQLLSVLSQIMNQSRCFPCIGPKQLYIWSFSQQDYVYQNCYQQISRIIDQNIQQVSRAKKVYQSYDYLLTRQSKILEWCETPRTIGEFQSQIQEVKELSRRILSKLPFTVRMNMIVVDGTDLKRKYISILGQIQLYLYQSIYQNIKRQYSSLNDTVEELKARLKPRADSTLKLIEVENEIFRIKKTQIPEVKESLKELKLWMDLLFKCGSPLMNPSDYREVYTVSQSIWDLGGLVSQSQQRTLLDKQEIERSLKDQTTDFGVATVKLSKQIIEMIQEFTVRKQFINYNKSIKQIMKSYQQFISTRTSINAQQQHLGWVLSKFVQLQHINRTLQPITQFWNIVAVVDVQLREWRTQPVKNLLSTEITATLEDNLEQLEKINQNQSGTYCLPYKVFTELRNQLIDMQQKYLPLIRIFANKGLKQRHWDAFSKEFQICENKDTLSLNKMISYKIVQEAEKICALRDISERASKEYTIQKTKSMMADEWYLVALSLNQFESTGVPCIGDEVELVMSLIVSQLGQIQEIKDLQQAKVFRQCLTQWEAWLKYTQTLFVEWTKIQAFWMYLMPMFTDQSVAKNFPLEHSEFQSIMNSWKSVMRRIQQQPRVVEFTKNKKILDIFLESSLKLSGMQNTIAAFIQERQGQR